MPLSSSLITAVDVAMCRVFRPSTRIPVFLRLITYGNVLSPRCASDHDSFFLLALQPIVVLYFTAL